MKRLNLALKFSKFELLSIVIMVTLLITALSVGVKGLFHGHEGLYNTSREMPIALLLGAYIFFVVTSTGLCIISAIGHVFHFEEFEPISKRAVFLSIATIMGGFVCLLFELDMPLNMYYFALSPNIKSGVWWMSFLYSFYLFFMICEFIALIFDKHSLGSKLGFLGLACGLAAHSNMGAVFGTLQGRTYWHGAFMPIYFIVSAFFSGLAAIIFFTYISKFVKKRALTDEILNSLMYTGRLLGFAIIIMLFFDIWKHIIGTINYAGEQTVAIISLDEGPLKVNFWMFEVACGMIIPLVLIFITKAKNYTILFISSIICIVGIFYMRYDLMLAGQIVPLWHEIGATSAQHYISYSPSIAEVLVFAGGLSFVGLLYLFGEKVFQLDVVHSKHQ